MNNEIAVSFASLVKSNNGFFKSEKQAAFLLSKCQDGNTFVCSGHVYRNPFTLYYICDAQGVVSVEKHTPKTGKTVTTWRRLSEADHVADVANKQAIKEADMQRQAESMARYQRRLDAFDRALLVAQEVFKAELVKDGTDEARAERMSLALIKDSDGISDCMCVLRKYEEFMQAWEIYNNEPGV